MLIDTHAHLYFDKLKDRLDEVLENATKNDVGIIINIGVDVETSKLALEQTRRSNSKVNIYSTIGLHPHDSSDPTLNKDSITDYLLKLKQIYLSDPKAVIGVGECGLDFYSENIPSSRIQDIDYQKTKDLQILLFESQINLSKELDLPLIIHCRDAWVEIKDYLNKVKGVLHCYSGDVEITKKVLKSDLYISFAGNITYPKNEDLRESLKLIPLDRILIETDSPFLSPNSLRGQTNEPSNIIETAQCIASVKGISLEKLANTTTQNARSVFKI